INVINAPKEVVEKQIVMPLQTLASLVESSGVDGMLSVINPDLLVKTASSMHVFKEQKELDAAIEILSNLDPKLWGDISKASLKPTNLVAAQALSNEIENLMGEKAAVGTMRRCMRKLFD
ncbi:MAG: 5,10-methenyltetrahydromethanopterin hydrogenase family protein, partial [Methanobacterium paludis]|nr:5,10-methenyltetrahydromethanopterin hydrogenase family protein [Methanobacterium paludis]